MYFESFEPTGKAILLDVKPLYYAVFKNAWVCLAVTHTSLFMFFS
jgi:hypothetical protein